MPGGFKIASDSADNVSDGVVIEDGKGNQFVWIPVTNSQQYVRNTSYEDAWSSSNARDDTGYLPSGVNDEKQAVLSAGGFYIARYEAGKEGDVVVSKNGAPGWASISQADCKEKSKTFVNNSYVKSALISGIQWDVTMAFVNRKKRWNRAKI